MISTKMRRVAKVRVGSRYWLDQLGVDLGHGLIKSSTPT